MCAVIQHSNRFSCGKKDIFRAKLILCFQGSDWKDYVDGLCLVLCFCFRGGSTTFLYCRQVCLEMVRVNVMLGK